ncbi:hypothetical protein [Paenibacillus sp. 1P07SE]|uniref:hypothetical protein n=1 Tax=Paenibacillus sp. 1P07SE TaxID=3132209 RepID=UPI0039A4E12A
MTRTPKAVHLLATDELHDLSEHIRTLLMRIDRLEEQNKRRNKSERRYRHLIKAPLPEA